MSTKNYYGLKILDNNLFIQELMQYKKKLYDTYTVKEIVQVLMNNYLIGNKFYENKILERKLDINEIEHFIDQFDHNKKMSVLPYQNPYDLTINLFPENNLAIPYFENEAHYKALLKFKSVQEYAYYNNVDMPENMTKKLWEQRELEWRNVESTYSFNKGYKNGITIEVFIEHIDVFNINNYINQHQKELLEQYLKDFVLNHSLKLFNDDYKNVSDNELYSKLGLSKLIKENKKYYNQFGDAYVQKILPTYLGILQKKLND